MMNLNTIEVYRYKDIIMYIVHVTNVTSVHVASTCNC